MKICSKNHAEIIHDNKTCPLCLLIDHNNKVHDFIESKGKDLVKELVAYQKKDVHDMSHHTIKNSSNIIKPKCPECGSHEHVATLANSNKRVGGWECQHCLVNF